MDYANPAGSLLCFGSKEDLSQGYAGGNALCGPGSAGGVYACAGADGYAQLPQEAGVMEIRMLGRLKQMIVKEFIQVFRDKRTRFILIGPPIIQMLVFGYAATYEIDRSE